jgi:thymidylate synthase (FAD)
MTNKIDVLDKGYVRLIDYMGSDISAVNAARASFDKQSELLPDGSLAPRDSKLLKYLLDNEEYSVFRHATVQFELYMPLMASNQFWKYVVGASHLSDGTAMNQSSRRYLTEDVQFYIPGATEWRGAPDNKKQGSGANLDPRIGDVATRELEIYCEEGERLYNQWVSFGMAPEQARVFLPAYNLYVRMRTTMSLAAFMHFLKERLGHGAQSEIKAYAQAMLDLTKPIWPVTLDLLLEEQA